MGIYTKNGDQGSTTNLLGEPLKKNSSMIELQGQVDETNATVGHLRALIQSHQQQTDQHILDEIDLMLKNIQYVLFRIGGDIAAKFTTNFVKEEDILTLEKAIDEMTEKVGALNHFIYYNGTVSCTYCHVVRSVVRRSERAFVSGLLSLEWQKAYPLDYQYVNRLSDFCFTLARYLNYVDGQVDEKMYLK